MVEENWASGAAAMKVSSETDSRTAMVAGEVSLFTLSFNHKLSL